MVITRVGFNLVWALGQMIMINFFINYKKLDPFSSVLSP